jgi:uncharacterized membrane protein YhiD involved in acid resistance
MIIVFFLVCVGVILLGAWLYNSVEEMAGGTTLFFGIAGGVVSFIAVIVLCIMVSGLKTLDNKIEMYQTENTNIENQIAQCVSEYQKYETDIFTEVSPDSAITLVSLYPELKADELVKKQIEVYVANNEKIKELKEKKIMGNVYRWWLYFGGGTK